MHQSSPSSRVPLPFVTGAVGLVISFIFRGQIGGATATLVGVGLGFLLLYVGQFVSERKSVQIRPSAAACPNCGLPLKVMLVNLPKQRGAETLVELAEELALEIGTPREAVKHETRES